MIGLWCTSFVVNSQTLSGFCIGVPQSFTPVQCTTVNPRASGIKILLLWHQDHFSRVIWVSPSVAWGAGAPSFFGVLYISFLSMFPLYCICLFLDQVNFDKTFLRSSGCLQILILLLYLALWQNTWQKWLKKRRVYLGLQPEETIYHNGGSHGSWRVRPVVTLHMRSQIW